MTQGKRLSLIFLGLFCLQTTPSFSEPADTALHLDWMDKTVAPGDNFYDYANASWQKNHPIPAAYASWDIFTIMQQNMQIKLHKMLSALASNPHNKPGSIEQKLGDFYFSGMDEKAINEQGIKPLQPLFNRIAAIKSQAELQALLPVLQLDGINVLFNFSSMQDFKNSESMIGAAFQGGLGLPNRDYYLKPDAEFVKIRIAYLKHITNMFKLLGDSHPQAEQEANVVMEIETTLAKASMTQAQQRDPNAIYHIMTLKALQAVTPQFSWSDYLRRLHLPPTTVVNLGMPGFFKTMDKLLKTVPLADWKTYYRWHVIHAFAPYLSKPFVDESFQMDRQITGTKELLPRWQRVVSTINANLDFAVGKLYVEKYFSEADKKEVQEIINNIRKEFRQALQNQQWMSAKTRQAAIKKLDRMQDRVGYPEVWRDYSKLKMTRGPYVINVIRAHVFENQRELNKIGKPVDRNEWSLSPQSINAYYDSSMNNINMLAGILQPPFFDHDAPAAVNYGSIGFVIGHEMTHGFDDKGSLFDGEGNLKDWWQARDRKQFKAATDCIAKQFSQYKVNGKYTVNGELVVGEATADLGGLILAYNAFHHSKAYQTAKTVDGFTPDQQFFLSAAHVWAGNIRPELAQHLVTKDPHPPRKYRVNGTFANMPGFQSAFGLPVGSPMLNAERCVIWE